MITKILPRVNKFRLQFYTIIHTKIHPHVIVHKSPPWNSAKYLSLIIFTYVFHQHAQKICCKIYLKLLTISKNITICPRDSTEETGWGHCGKPEPAPHEIFLSPPDMHHHTLILQRPRKNLSPNTHHYSLHNLWTFLKMLIFGYLDLNTAINSST